MKTPAKSFQQIVNSPTPTLVDFFATWCGPCKAMAPMLEAVKDELGEQVVILKVDVDRNPQAAQAFQVQAVPTLLLFKNGKVVWRQSGVVPPHQLKQVILGHSA